MIQFDGHIFQMAWFNHQLGLVVTTTTNPQKTPWLPELPPRFDQVENWVQPKPVYMKRTKLQIEVTLPFLNKKCGKIGPLKKKYPKKIYTFH